MARTDGGRPGRLGTAVPTLRRLAKRVSGVTPQYAWC